MPLLPYTADGGLVGARAVCDSCGRRVDVGGSDCPVHEGLPFGWISAATAQRITATLCSWPCVVAFADARVNDHEREQRRQFELN